MLLKVVLGDELLAPLHERPDRGGGGVEDGHAVPRGELPPAGLVRGVGGALVDQLRRAVGQRAVDHVAVPGHPADVGGAPVDVGLRAQVEHRGVGVGDLREVAAGGVEDALGLPGRARGVEDEERVLGVERLGRVLVGGGVDDVVPPQVAALGPLHVLAGAPDHDDVLHAVRAAVQGPVDRRLERGRAAAAVAAVGGDDELRLGVVDPAPQRVGAEPAEDDAVRGAEPGAGEHGDDGLGDHRQVHRDPVALADAEGGEGVGRPADLLLQVGVGDGAGVAGLALEVDGDPVAVAGLDVAVDAVVGGVELPADVPPREGRVGPVEGLGEVLLPVQALAGLPRPEAEPVGGGLLVQPGPGDGVAGELLGRGEPAALDGQVLQRLGGLRGHRCSFVSIGVRRAGRPAAVPSAG